MPIEFLNPISRHLAILALLLLSPLAFSQNSQVDNQTSDASPKNQEQKHNSDETANSIEARVKKVLIKHGIGDSSLQNNNVSFSSLGLDSLSQVELLMALENEFNMQIPDTEAEKIKTVQQAINFITRHKK